MKLLIDGDLVGIRQCFSVERTSYKVEDQIFATKTEANKYAEYTGGVVESFRQDPGFDKQYAAVRDFIHGMVDLLKPDETHLYLTGAGNYRKEIYPEYKAKRVTFVPPAHWLEIRSCMMEDMGGVGVDGLEADDLLGLHATAFTDTVIVSNDKDFHTVPGTKLDPWKIEWTVDSVEDARRFFLYQMLIGDATDGVIGIKGLGPKTADKIMAGIDNKELWGRVKQEYENKGVSNLLRPFVGCLWIQQNPSILFPPLCKEKLTEAEQKALDLGSNFMQELFR